MFCSIMRRQPVFNHGQNVTVAATSLPLSIAHWFTAQSCRFDGFIDLPVFKADPTQIVSQQNIESLAQNTEHLIECAWQWSTRMSRTADGGAHGSWRSINLNKKNKNWVSKPKIVLFSQFWNCNRINQALRAFLVNSILLFSKGVYLHPALYFQGFFGRYLWNGPLR